MFNKSEIEMHELTIEQAKEAIAISDALNRLAANKDFNLVIDEGYFIKEASRLVLLKAAPAMMDAESQKAIDNQIIAIGQLRQYFTWLYMKAVQSEKAIIDSEANIDELLTTEVEV